MRKIVILNNIPQFESAIKTVAPDWEVVFTKDKAMAEAHLADAEIIVSDWTNIIAKHCFKEGSKLRWLQSWSAGVDDVPLAELEKQGIILTSASGVHTRQLSESIFASILALDRKIPASVIAQSRSKWMRREIRSLPSGEIHGKTLGILGVGKIGEEVAKIARGFSMYTLGLKRSKTPIPYVDDIYTTDQLHEMLSRSEYIVNLLPLTKDTKGIIDKKAFDTMRPGTKYFAFGRGETTDTTALIEALQSGRLAAVGLDVVNPEPLPSDSPLWKMGNVLITPHISGSSSHYNERAMEIFLENLANYVAGNRVSRSRIDYSAQY